MLQSIHRNGLTDSSLMSAQSLDHICVLARVTLSQLQLTSLATVEVLSSELPGGRGRLPDSLAGMLDSDVLLLTI